MNNSEHAVVAQHDAGHGSTISYITGFVLSIACTIAPYLLVTKKLLSGTALIGWIVGFALLQLLVQLVFFLHLGRESKPRWNMYAFLFAAMVVLIIVFGSLWIMYNLDYNMMPAHDIEQHIMEEEGIYR